MATQATETPTSPYIETTTIPPSSITPKENTTVNNTYEYVYYYFEDYVTTEMI